MASCFITIDPDLQVPTKMAFHPWIFIPFTSFYHVWWCVWRALIDVDPSPGVVLPLSLFYDEPSLLDAAKYLHRAAGSDEAGDEENLEALLQDDEARRSYQLSQGRSAMNAKDRADGMGDDVRIRCWLSESGWTYGKLEEGDIWYLEPLGSWSNTKGFFVVAQSLWGSKHSGSNHTLFRVWWVSHVLWHHPIPAFFRSNYHLSGFVICSPFEWPGYLLFRDKPISSVESLTIRNGCFI